MSDLISRQAAIDALYDWSEHSMTNAEAWHIKQVIGDIKSLPSAQPETCDTCKHGYFGDMQCDNCCVGYPSHYERRTDEYTD